MKANSIVPSACVAPNGREPSPTQKGAELVSKKKVPQWLQAQENDHLAGIQSTGWDGMPASYSPYFDQRNIVALLRDIHVSPWMSAGAMLMPSTAGAEDP